MPIDPTDVHRLLRNLPQQRSVDATLELFDTFGVQLSRDSLPGNRQATTLPAELRLARFLKLDQSRAGLFPLVFFVSFAPSRFNFHQAFSTCSPPI